MTGAPRLRLRDVELFSRDVATRMPFRFGKVTMTRMQVAYARVVVATGGREWTGTAASVLSPMWFDKDPRASFGQKAERLLLSIALAADAYVGAGEATAFGLHEIAAPAVAARSEGRMNRLTAGFGVALVDSAVVDAVCRSQDVTFHETLAADLLGFGPVPGLPDSPLGELWLRHTVGLGDPIAASDVAEPLDDGLPESLEEVVARYGHELFKIKVTPGAEARARLGRIAAVLDGAGLEWGTTLDGNESFEDATALAALIADCAGRNLVDRTLWIEQPLPRDESLRPGVLAGLEHAGLPIILDESDATDGVVTDALELGYGGISAKNCKGIFRTLHSKRVVEEWNATHPGDERVLSGEDLTSPGVFAFQQDTCVMAALGVEHVERNAHHYARGLDHLTEAERRAALAEFPSLWERRDDGLVTLKIRGGRIDVSEVVANGYGTVSEPEWEALAPLALPDP